MRYPVVGIFPAARRRQCSALFDALEDMLEVRLPARDVGDWAELDAAILVASDAEKLQRTKSAVPHLLVAEDHLLSAKAQPGAVHFHNDPWLPTCLRARSLQHENGTALRSLDAREADRVLATTDRGPIWVQRRREQGAGVFDCIACAPAELKPGNSLHAALRGNSFFPVLPIVHFLRTMAPDLAWIPPPLRATFLFDDPNLHWRSYGYIDFATLTSHARRHRYHAAFAMIPLDARFASASAVRLFRQNTEHLSLLLHGNNHTFRELGRPAVLETALPILAQALRRMMRFERRTGLAVSRVIVAPHNDASDAAIRAMASIGIEALASTRSHLSLVGSERRRRWITCAPAITVGDGFPILARHAIGTSLEDLVIRAFLGQPLILYGHHTDLAEGVGVLAETAEAVNALGHVRWCSLEEIVRTNFATRREGSHLSIRAYAAHLRLAPQVGVESVSVASAAEGDSQAWRAVRSLGAGGRRMSHSASPGKQPFAVLPAETLELTQVPAMSVDLDAVPDPAWRPAPVLRRIAAEARDRIAPLLYPAAKQ